MMDIMQGGSAFYIFFSSKIIIDISDCDCVHLSPWSRILLKGPTHPLLEFQPLSIIYVKKISVCTAKSDRFKVDKLPMKPQTDPSRTAFKKS